MPRDLRKPRKTDCLHVAMCSWMLLCSGYAWSKNQGTLSWTFLGLHPWSQRCLHQTRGLPTQARMWYQSGASWLRSTLHMRPIQGNRGVPYGNLNAWHAMACQNFHLQACVMVVNGTLPCFCKEGFVHQGSIDGPCISELQCEILGKSEKVFPNPYLKKSGCPLPPLLAPPPPNCKYEEKMVDGCPFYELVCVQCENLMNTHTHTRTHTHAHTLLIPWILVDFCPKHALKQLASKLKGKKRCRYQNILNKLGCPVGLSRDCSGWNLGGFGIFEMKPFDLRWTLSWTQRWAIRHWKQSVSQARTSEW